MTPPNPPFGGWRKSSHSGSGTHGDCVEVAALAHRMVGLRDSKNPAGPVLTLSRTEWSAFIRDVRGA